VDTWSAPSFGFESDARISLGWIFLSGLCWYVCTAGADQMNIQRYLSTRDAKAARTAFITCMGADALITLFLAAVGLALLGYFQANPHMLPDGERLTDNADAAFPRFIVLGLPAGVSGLVIAGLFAAAMSNLAAGINSATSVITVDFVDRAPSGNHISTERNVRLAKWISVLVGAVVVGLSVLVSYIGGNLLEVAFKASNLLVVPLFILFFMAMFVPWATTVAAWLAAAASLGVSIVIAYWDVIVGTDKGPSFTWMMPLSLVTGITVGCLASLIPFTTMKKEGVSTLKSIAETGAET
jgi:SSS family solute:Na+ symporter